MDDIPGEKGVCDEREREREFLLRCSFLPVFEVLFLFLHHKNAI